MASTIYDVQVPGAPGIPPTLDVHITVMRRDGKPLTAEELEALRDAYPPPTADGRAAVEAAITAASAKPAGKAKSSASTKPRKAPAKRAAAKRP